MDQAGQLVHQSDGDQNSWDSWWQLTSEERKLERSAEINFTELIRDAVKEKKLKPEKNPATPQWPFFEKIDYEDPEREAKLKLQALAEPHKRTIEKLAYGPYKGKKAIIERSGWSLWGVDTMYSAKSEHIMGVNLPLMWTFYFKLPALHIDGYVPIYYGHVCYENGHHAGRVIPESWLSEKDKINLFNFHRWELEVLASKYGARLFDPQSPARPVLRAKIKNELDRCETVPMCTFLRVNRRALLQDPECAQRMLSFTKLNKEIAIARETADPSDTWSDSIFLHALFLEALKHEDVEILTNRRILYNSLWVLDQKSFDEIKKKEGDLDAATIFKKIDKWLPLAEIMRENEYVDAHNMIYTDLLPRDIRSHVIALMLYKVPQVENTTV